MKNKNTMFFVFFYDKSPNEENVAEFCMRRIYPEKRENVVTIDASWAYLRGYYLRIKSEEKNLRAWFKESEESVSKEFIIVGGFEHSEKLKISNGETILRSIPHTIKNILQCHHPIELGQDKTSHQV